MTITAGWVEAAATVATMVAGLAGAWLHSAFSQRDAKIIELEGAHRATRETQGTLFGKYDTVHLELQSYKLHVAETYVNQAALQKMIDPIDRRLENIEKELRQRGASA